MLLVSSFVHAATVLLFLLYATATQLSTLSVQISFYVGLRCIIITYIVW